MESFAFQSFGRVNQIEPNLIFALVTEPNIVGYYPMLFVYRASYESHGR